MRFKVGEIAIDAGIPAGNSEYPFTGGDEVEVVAVGPFKPGDIIFGLETDLDIDYVICGVASPGAIWGVDEKDLRKRRPPGFEIAREIMANIPQGVTCE